MVLVTGISLPTLARITRRSMERLRYVARKAGIAPECRVGTIKLYTVEAAAEIVARASSVRHYKRQASRRKAPS